MTDEQKVIKFSELFLPITKSKGLSPFENIFMRQLTILTRYSRKETKVEHIMALILIGWFLRRGNAEQSQAIRDLTETRGWLRKVVKELDEAKTESATIAISYIDAEYDWTPSTINSGGWIEIKPDSLSIKDHGEFLQLCWAGDKCVDKTRGGWKNWGVRGVSLLETPAEHCGFAQIVAVAMHAIYKYKVAIEEVLATIGTSHLAGELTVTDKNPTIEQKEELLVTYARMIFGLEDFHWLYGNFEKLQIPEKRTQISRLAGNFGSLSNIIRAKEYQNHVNLAKQGRNPAMKHPFIKALCAAGCPFAVIWAEHGKEYHDYEEHTLAVVEEIERQSR